MIEGSSLGWVGGSVVGSLFLSITLTVRLSVRLSVYVKVPIHYQDSVEGLGMNTIRDCIGPLH